MMPRPRTVDNRAGMRDGNLERICVFMPTAISNVDIDLYSSRIVVWLFFADVRFFH